MVKKHFDHIIIGGGVSGCSIAYHLSKRGNKVLLLEADEIAAGASRAAAGMLGVQMEFTEYSPFFEFAQESRSMHTFLAESLFKQTGINVHYMKKGAMKLAFTEQELTQLHAIAHFQQRAGLDARVLSPLEIKKLEPNIVSHEIVGGLYCPEEAHVSAPHLTWALAKAAANHGTIIHERTCVTTLITQGDKVIGVETSEGNFYAEQVVLATGTSLNRFDSFLPDNISITAVKGECVALKSEKPIFNTTIFSERCYIVSKTNQSIFIGATVKENQEDSSVHAGSVHQLLHHAFGLIPELQHASFSHVWSGLRPRANREVPYLSEVPSKKGLYIAAGHYRNGILLAPMTGVYMADLLEGKTVTPAYRETFSIQNKYRLVKEEYH